MRWGDRRGAIRAFGLAVTLLGTMIPTARMSAATPGAIPHAVRELASSVGVKGTPAVGDRPSGSGGPWYVWFPRTVARGEVKDGIILRRMPLPSGKMLFADARGALGEYHFFDPSQVTARFGGLPGNTLRKRAIAPRAAAREATQWLQRVGTPLPAEPVQVVSGPEAGPPEELFGDFEPQYAVSWGNAYSPSQDGIRSSGPVVWISPTEKVFEVDIGYLPHQAFPGRPSDPCPGSSTTDSRGVSTGAWCFDYARVVQAQISISGTWWTDPRTSPDLTANNRDPVRLGIPMLRTLSPTQAVWVQAYRGEAYRSVYSPAFPGLIGSVWGLTQVRSRALRAAHISTLQARAAPPCPLIGSPAWIEDRWVNGLGNRFGSTPPTHRIVRQERAVRALYRSFCSLVRDSSDAVRMCPIDRGDLFHLTFHGRSGVLIRATVDMEGCSNARADVPGFSRFVYTPSLDFVDDLAAALGIPNKDLWPHIG